MTTKVIKGTNTRLFLDVSSGSTEAFDALKRQSTNVTEKATSFMSEMDAKTIETLISPKEFKVDGNK